MAEPLGASARPAPNLAAKPWPDLPQLGGGSLRRSLLRHGPQQLPLLPLLVQLRGQREPDAGPETLGAAASTAAEANSPWKDVLSNVSCEGKMFHGICDG